MSSPNTSPRSAWQLLAFLTLLNVVNFVDRQLITSLQVPIREELGLSLLQITVLAGYAFAVIYAIAGLFLGTVADRWHRPRLIALGLFVWSALTAASGLAQNFWQLSLARFFIGIGEVTLTPAAIAMLSDVFQPRQRALASGLYYLGIPIGAGLSLIVGGSFGNFLGGWLGDLFHKRWSGGRLLAVVAIQAVIAPFGMAFRLLPPDSFLFLLCGLLSPILVTMIYGPIYASVQELTPIRVRATMIAVLIVGLMLLGASLGGPLAAYIAERLMAAGFAQPLTAGIFIAGQVGLLAIPLLFLAARRYSHDLARVHETV